MKLKTQSIFFSTLIVLALLIQASSGLWSLRFASNQDNKTRVVELFTSSYNTVVALERLAEEGVLSDPVAKSIAKEILISNEYNQTEYVFVADENLVFLAAPHDPQLHGTSFHEFRDSDGNSVGEILQEVTSGRAGEMVEYHWNQRREDGTVEDKLSIAEETPRWGWYVGTGIGFDEVNERFWGGGKIPVNSIHSYYF